MANIGTNGFDATHVDPTVDFEHVPASRYTAEITDSDMRDNSKGTGEYLWLEFTILDGPYAGRKLWTQLNLVNPSAQAVEIAQRELSAICHATGKLRVQDSIELHNIPLLPKCRILSIWATKTTRIVVLPQVDDKVMVGFENGDHIKPYIQGFIPDQGPDGLLLIEAEKARIRIDQEGKIELQTDKDIEITCQNCKVTASGNIDLGENGAGIITGGPQGTLPACFVTGAPIPCSATVKAKK